MIRTLRIRLILASMVSLLLVLTVILGAAGILNYRKIVTDADSILDVLAENDGVFPADKHLENDFFSTGRHPRYDRLNSPELPYESRYFSVFLTQDGTTAAVSTGKIAAVDTQAAIEYAQMVLNSGDSRGFVENYRYILYLSGDEIHIIFLDCRREIGAFQNFLLTSTGVGLLGLFSVLLLLIILSGRIVKPFSENYEKQKQFITDAGHELKTPLTIIDADAEVLEMDVGENEWLSDIKNQTKRLAQLTNNLIFLSRMEEQPQVEKIEFPISDLAEETLEAFQALAKTRNKTISSQIEPMLSMVGDENAIRQLIVILLDNAVKYSDDGGKIELSLQKKKNTIQLGVFNTAESISRADIPHLFDRFYRADRSRNSQTGGYGLGLSIASAIVNAHKGKITSNTQDKKSLLITVTFPL